MSETTTPKTDAHIATTPEILKVEGMAFTALGKWIAGILETSRALETELSRASAPVSQRVREALELALTIAESVVETTNADWRKGDIESKNAEDDVRIIREALTLLAPDTRTEYDKAVEALAPYLPDGFIAQDPNGETSWFENKPSHNTYYWLDEEGSTEDPQELTGLRIPKAVDAWESVRPIKSGKVVHHV